MLHLQIVYQLVLCMLSWPVCCSPVVVSDEASSPKASTLERHLTKGFYLVERMFVQEADFENPNFTRTFVLQADALDYSIGAVLSQIDDNGLEHPFAFYSRKLHEREQRYAMVEKECLAIKLGIQAFKVYLHGRSLWYRQITMPSHGYTD